MISAFWGAIFGEIIFEASYAVFPRSPDVTSLGFISKSKCSIGFISPSPSLTISALVVAGGPYLFCFGLVP